jgi:sulfur-oxidizing protein SoxA
VRGLFLLLLLAASASAEPPSPLKSGIEFLGPEIQRLQSDDFANPGMLWVSRGEKLFKDECARCHDAAKMKGVAVSYPRMVDGRLMGLSARINSCRQQKMGAEPYAAESEPLLALTAFVAHQSRGMPIVASADPGLAPHLERARRLYHTRIGQMNLACTHCHDRNAGKRLLNETVSQGHPNAFPAYRMSWESVGSIERRIRACFYGVRAEMPEYGAPELLELELYLARRAAGLPLETPGVRR